MCVYIYMCIYIYICVSVYRDKQTHRDFLLFSRTYIYMYIYIHIHACMSVCSHTVNPRPARGSDVVTLGPKYIYYMGTWTLGIFFYEVLLCACPRRGAADLRLRFYLKDHGT